MKLTSVSQHLHQLFTQLCLFKINGRRKNIQKIKKRQKLTRKTQNEAKTEICQAMQQRKKNEKASSPVKHNNQLKDGDGQEKAHIRQKAAEKSTGRSQKRSRK